MAVNKDYTSDVILLALVRYGRVEPRLMDRLLRLFESPSGILVAEREQLAEIEGLNEDHLDDLVSVIDNLDAAADYLSLLNQREILVTSRMDHTYPGNLFELNDPPSLLFRRGKLPDPALKRVAVTGTDNPSNEGIELTVKLCRRLAEEKVQIISTLRRGIDAAAHIGANSGKGCSFAVLETGFDELPTDEIMPVAMSILGEGGIISEHLPEAEIGASGFHGSNRILAALAQAVVFTEFYSDSERTLDMLQCCAEIGKLCFVLIDPEHGAFTDETSLARAVECGAIPMKGLDKIDDIIKALV
ncbi:MAG TPA: DNA-processing protein DprA [candidate division Zixibacteria bacterium]|nr:DNA-processing protein DprA [candidate division Zixibacteria bacterium]